MKGVQVTPKELVLGLVQFVFPPSKTYHEEPWSGWCEINKEHPCPSTGQTASFLLAGGMFSKTVYAWVLKKRPFDRQTLIETGRASITSS